MSKGGYLSPLAKTVLEFRPCEMIVRTLLMVIPFFIQKPFTYIYMYFTPLTYNICTLPHLPTLLKELLVSNPGCCMPCSTDNLCTYVPEWNSKMQTKKSVPQTSHATH